MGEKKSLYNYSNKKLKIAKPLIESKNIVFDSGNIYVDPDYYLKNMDEEEAELYHETNDYIRNEYSIVAVNEEEEDKELYENRFDEAYYNEENQVLDYGDDEENEYEMVRREAFEKGEDDKKFDDIFLEKAHEESLVDKGEDITKKIKNIYTKEKIKEMEKERIEKELNFQLASSEFEKDRDLVERFESFQNN
jgi:hypothetical protein